MKRTEILKELNAKDSKALNKQLIELNHKLAKLNLDAAMRKLKNVKSIKETRHTVARIMTILKERALTDLAKVEQDRKVTK
ncbi:MAG: 50S ribosomal protein L29 [Candidatus Berkelbacteria bacterium]